MKCNQCGTTIPEGSKICNGCGKKVTIFSSKQNSTSINNNYRIINNYTKPIQTKKIENLEEYIDESKVQINNINIQDKNASLATVLSVIGVMFIPIGVIFCKKSITIAQKIEDPILKNKILTTSKILFAISIFMSLFVIIPIIIGILSV